MVGGLISYDASAVDVCVGRMLRATFRSASRAAVLDVIQETLLATADEVIQ